MLKKLIYTLTLIIASHFAKADLGYSYCFEVELNTNSLIKKGFIRINSYCEIKEDSLRMDGYFNKILFKSCHTSEEKNIILHKYSIPIIWDEKNEITYLSKNINDTILIKDIKSIKVISKCFSYVGTEILNTLRLKSSAWASNKPIRQEEFGYDVCGIKILVYEQSKELDNLIIKLKASTKNINNWNSFYEIIEKMNEFKVIVTQTCSC